MLRVRFHGRGGHGIKTASRILGTAAFLSGLEVQDSPIYGAERRGAALTAFTRLDAEPIRERGVVTDPDLVLIADETLLQDPAVQALQGQEFASAVLINSARDGASLAQQHGAACPVLTLDLTALCQEVVGRGSALSAALGAAGCALAGLGPLELVLRAVREELADLHLAPELIERNVEAARRAYASLGKASLRQRPDRQAGVLHPPAYAPGPEGVAIIYAQGNAHQRHTGSWRLSRPVIDLPACTRCSICFALCPDGAIHLDANAYPVIDYDNCKGCMICRQECPVHCIQEEKEVRAW